MNRRARSSFFVLFLWIFVFFSSAIVSTYRFVRAQFNYSNIWIVARCCYVLLVFLFICRWLKFLKQNLCETVCRVLDLFLLSYCFCTVFFEGLATTWNIWNFVFIHSFVSVFAIPFQLIQMMNSIICLLITKMPEPNFFVLTIYRWWMLSCIDVWMSLCI